MPTIQLLQHIRTSSKARKGFGTFQKSPELSQQEDNLLSVYGDFQPGSVHFGEDTEDQSQPQKFSFYILPGGKRVFSRSVYVGMDRHSTPPRPGNIITHSFILENEEIDIFPHEIFLSEKIGWVDEQYMEANDTIGVSEEISAKPFESKEKDFLAPEVFEFLLEGTARLNMFNQIVDLLIEGVKVVLIDNGDILPKWCLALSQAFPIALSGKKLTFSSNVHDITMFSVCRLIGVEPNRAERAKRFASQEGFVLIEQGSSRNHHYYYLDQLSEHIKNNKFSDFTNHIFPRLVGISNFNAEEFESGLQFVKGLERLAEMPSNEFKSWYEKNRKDVKSVISSLENHERKDLLKILIEIEVNALKKEGGPLEKQIRTLEERIISALKEEKYKEELKGFAIDQLERKRWEDMEICLRALSPIREGERLEKYVREIKDKINSGDFPILKIDTKLVDEKLPLLSEENKKLFLDIDTAKGSLEILDNPSSTIQKKLSYLNDLLYIKNIQLTPYMDSPFELDWKLFFSLLQEEESKKNIISIFHALKSSPIQLFGVFKNTELLTILLEEEFELKDVFNEYLKLSLDSQSKFLDAADPGITEKIIEKELIGGFSGRSNFLVLEDFFKKHEAISSDLKKRIIEIFFDNLTQTKDTNSIWDILKNVASPVPYSSVLLKFKSHIHQIANEAIKELYEKSDKDVEPEHEKLAHQLNQEGELKIRLPKQEYLNDINSLKYLSHISEIKPILKKILKEGNTLNELKLDSLIKKGWDWHYWHYLISQINDEKKTMSIVTNLIKSLTSYGDEIEQKEFEKIQYWKDVILELALCLILTDRVDLLKILLSCASDLKIKQKDIEYLERRLSLFSIEKSNQASILFKDRYWEKGHNKGYFSWKLN